MLSVVRGRVAGGESLPRALAGAPGGPVSVQGLLADHARAQRDLLGAGDAVQRLLEDPAVTDVVVHAARVWVDRGHGLEAVPAPVGSESEVRALAVRLAALAGQRLDDAAPIVDGVLPGGTRLHAVLPPLAADGTSISLRPLHQRDFTLDVLAATGMVGEETRDLLAGLVVRRANVVVAGATGTGKTTLLAALLALVPPTERLVCIEEASELRPNHPHVVHLQARSANVQAAGSVSLSDLVRAALRMRPDRVVLGEARGREVRDVLAALNTGHAGSWFTLHANSSADVPARLVALGALAGLDPAAVAVQAGAALDAVVFLRREAGQRWVAEIARLDVRAGTLAVDVVAHVVEGTVHHGPGWEGFRARWSP